MEKYEYKIKCKVISHAVTGMRDGAIIPPDLVTIKVFGITHNAKKCVMCEWNE